MSFTFFDSPFPHLRGESILSSVSFEAAVKKLNTGDGFDGAFNLGRARSNFFNKRRLYCIKEDEADVSLKRLRSEICKVVVPNASFVWPDTVRQSNLKLDVLLVRDLSGYELEPHTDISAKLWTLLIYLQTDSVDADLGTRLWKVKQRPAVAADGANNDYPFELEPGKQLSFDANTGWFFVRSDRSFHSVDCRDSEFSYRDVLIVTAYHTRLPASFLN